MIKNSFQPLFAALSLVLLTTIFGLSSCTKATDVGADLLDGDRLNTSAIDTMTIRTTTIKGDSVRTFSDLFNSQQTDYIYGKVNDPLFGTTTSAIYLQLKTGGLIANFDGATLDSMVLALPYLADQQYGEINEPFSMDIMRLSEVVETQTANTNYYSSEVFDVAPTPIQDFSFSPMMDGSDSLNVIFPSVENQNEEDTVLLKPHLRIPMDPTFADELFNADTSIFKSDTDFLEAFSGFQLLPSSTNNGFLNFSLKDDSNAGLFVYYTKDGVKRIHQFLLTSSSLKMTTYNHDYSGSVVNGFLQGNTTNDSIFFVQGLAGVNGLIEFPYIEQLRGNRVINKAELEVYIANLPEDNGNFDPVNNIILSEIRDDGSTLLIDDVILALNAANLNGVFGGNIIEDEDNPGAPDHYQMNITAHVQEMIKGNASNKMQLSVYIKPQQANRVALYGANHSQYPIRLKITYTDF